MRKKTKRFHSRLLTLAIAVIMLLLTACNDNGDSGSVAPPAATPTKAATAEPTPEPTAEPEPKTAPDADVDEDALTDLAKDDAGDGPVTLGTSCLSMTIPEGMKYQVYELYDSEDAFTAEFWYGQNFALSGSVHVSSTRMISSLDDAANECERMRGFDGAKTREDIGEAEYGDMTYHVMTISDSSETKTYYVGHYKNDTFGDMYIEVAVITEGMFSMQVDDPNFLAIINSLKFR